MTSYETFSIILTQDAMGALSATPHLALHGSYKWTNTKETTFFSFPVGPVLPHWTRTGWDCRQGGQFSLNIILCIWKPHLLNNQWCAEHHHTQPTAFALIEQPSLMSPEKRVRGGPAPQFSPAFVSWVCGSDTGMISAMRSALQSSEALQGMSCRGHFWRLKNSLVQGSCQ